MNPHRPRVLIADDHALIAESIAGLMKPHFDIVGICPDGRTMVTEALRLKPDVVAFDIGMPGLNGLEAAARIASSLPSVRLVCVTQQIDQHYLSAALRAGACAFIAKQSSAHELIAGIQAAMNGDTYITPLLEETYRQRALEKPYASTRNSSEILTPRQREVLQMVAEGRQSKEIASTLHISLKTVEFHRSALMNILGVRSAAELTRYALAHGIVQ